MRLFARKYLPLLLCTLLILGLFSWRYPVIIGILVGIFNTEFAIGIWLRLGYTVEQTLVLACIFANAGCVFWYYLIGRKIAKKRKAVNRMEKKEIARNSIVYHLRQLWKSIGLLFEPERYARHWVYRLIVGAYKRRYMGMAARMLGYGLMTFLCILPGVMFPLIAVAHIVKMRFALIAILLGNTAKMVLAAYGWHHLLALF